MLRELVQSWSHDPWVMEDSNNDNVSSEANPLNVYDQNALFTSLLQLQQVLNHDDEFLSFEADNSLYYDEYTFVPDTYVTETIEPSSLVNDYNHKREDVTTAIVDDPSTLEDRRPSDCSSLSSFNSSKDFDSIGEGVISSFQNSQLDTELRQKEEDIDQSLDRKQLEELILEKITHKLEPHRLPGILSIINAVEVEGEEVEEVEVDLERLEYDQLKRILAYVDACLSQKEGGPLVDISNYIAMPAPAPVKLPYQQITKKPQKRKSKNNKRQQPFVDGGHVVDGSFHSQLSSTHGLLSMSALTDIEEAEDSMDRKKNYRKRKKTKKTKTKNEKKSHKPPPKNIKKPGKRRTAIHKRKMLEDMLGASSSNETDEEDEGKIEGGSGIIIFGNEKMDFAVTQNQTIAHNERRLSLSQQQSAMVPEHTGRVECPPTTESYGDDIDDEEIIDIMS